jgi:hypothetical protein
MRTPLRLLLPAIIALTALGAFAGPALAAPNNDAFANAEQLTGNRGYVNFDLTGATHQQGEPLTGDSSDVTGWYRYSPSANGLASFSTCRTETDLVTEGLALNLYSGGALATLTSAAHATGGCKNGRVNVTTTPISVQANHDYWLQIEFAAAAEITGGKLDFDFNAAVPENDDLADAQAISGSLPQTIDADNGLASIEDDETYTQDWGPRNSLWYSWTPETSGTVSIDTCSTDWSGGEIDSRIFVSTDGDPDPEVTTLNHVTDNDDACPAPKALLSHAYFEAVAGTTYFVRVANYNQDFGYPYKLRIRWVGAPEIPVDPLIYPGGGRVQIGSTYGVDVKEWAADPAITETSLQWLLCNAEGASCSEIDGATGTDYTVLPGDLGHRLRVRATGTNSVTSTSVESAASGLIENSPDNDDFADAVDLGSAAYIHHLDDNYFATTETGEDDVSPVEIAATVWYRWIAPQSRTYLVGNCAPVGSSDLRIAVFTASGPLLSDATGLASSSDGCEATDDAGARASFAATSGVTYWIQSGSGPGENQADFTLTIDEAPAPSFTTQPALSGDAVEGDHFEVSLGEWSSAIAASSTIAWSLCDASGSNCTDANQTSDSLELTAAMVGKRAKATVTVANANGSTSASALSGTIASRPVQPPPGGGPDPGPPIDPFPQLSVAKSLGKLKVSKKNTIALAKLALACGASATGPCTGSITFTTAKLKKSGKTIKPVKISFKLSAAPGKSAPTTFKLSSAAVKAVKAAKSLKTTIAIQFGAPGFSKKTASSSATLAFK